MKNEIEIAVNSALLVIDVQKGFDDPAFWGPRNNPDCEANIAALLPWLDWAYASARATLAKAAA